MKKIITAICAATLVAATSIVPAGAQSFSIDLGTGQIQLQQRGDDYYYNGYRGYRQRRDGYREYRGYFFPPEAFIQREMRRDDRRDRRRDDRRDDRRDERRSDREWARHVDWCHDRYRSYRESDNSFQPNNGPRRECRSPYYG